MTDQGSSKKQAYSNNPMSYLLYLECFIVVGRNLLGKNKRKIILHRLCVMLAPVMTAGVIHSFENNILISQKQIKCDIPRIKRSEHTCKRMPGNTRLYIHACKHTPANTRLQTHACKHTPANTRLHTHAYKHTPTNTRLQIHACKHTPINIRLQTHSCTRTPVYSSEIICTMCILYDS